jgi:hypothetical protein
MVLMEIVGGAWLRVDDYWMVLVVQLGAGDGGWNGVLSPLQND